MSSSAPLFLSLAVIGLLLAAALLLAYVQGERLS